MKTTAMLVSAALMISGSALADGNKTFEVTITNITAGQSFTPVLAATHTDDTVFFEQGAPASVELEKLAEGGMTLPLQDLLNSMPQDVYDTATTEGLLGPGDSVTFEIQGSYRHTRLSFAAMLLPTHDTFVSVDSMTLPHWSATATAMAYDAGTEVNDENCDHIPGPFCGGEGYSEDGGEGFVHIANGIHGIGDLAPEVFDWRGPVATVSIRRLK
jgi:hypothetical protein